MSTMTRTLTSGSIHNASVKLTDERTLRSHEVIR
jgi:hypothetical protein